MQRSKTHSEPIPVEIVKKIANEIPGNSAIENESVSVETRDVGTPAQGDWCEVAQRVQRAQDPKTLIELVEQLIAAFDQEQLCKRLPRKRDAGNPSD